MDIFYYILLVALMLLGMSSLSIKGYKTASLLVILWSFLLFSMNGFIEDISARGLMSGMFFLSIVSLLMTFMFLVFYQIETRKLLLKLATTSAAIAITNILCIMTYISEMRDGWWYYSPFFDLFYWQYGNLQIILTLYMISLFWKSGIMGLQNGFNRLRSKLNGPRSHILDVDSLSSRHNSLSRIDNSLLVGQDRNNKKGIL